MKKSLTLVCRSWNSIAIEFLYEFIALRQLGHIPGLLRTFRADSSIGGLVKMLAVIFLPAAKNRRLVTSGLSSILKLCTNLKELTFPHYWKDLHSGMLWWISEDLLPQLHLTDTLTRLHLPWCDLNDPGVVKQLNSCTNLVELGISTYCGKDDVLATAPFQNSGRTVLRKLEHLRVNVFSKHTNGAPCTESPFLLRVITESWDMPNLRTFTINTDFLSVRRPDPKTLMILFRGLFEVHCQGLLSLQARGLGDVITRSLILLCPRLEHLIIVKDSWLFSEDCAGHPTVKWIDVWSSDREPLHVLRQRLHQLPCFPNLQSIRELGEGLGDWSELPFIFPPNSTSDHDDQEVVLYHFPGTDIAVHKHYIRAQDAVYHDSDSDTSYLWSGTSDLEDPSDLSSIDWEEFAYELQSQDDDNSEQLGSEEILDVFTKVLIDED
jgi:hypothetical protein